MARFSSRLAALASLATLAFVPAVAGAPAAAAATNASGCSAWHNTSTPDNLVQTKVCITLTHQSIRGHSSAHTRIDVISSEYYSPYAMSLKANMTEWSQAEVGGASATSFGSPSSKAYKGYASVSVTKDIASHYRMWATVVVTVNEGGRTYTFSLTSPKERVE